MLTIPDADVIGPSAAIPESPAAEMENPFGVASRAAEPDKVNPYASPANYETGPERSGEPHPERLTPTRIDFNNITSETWKIFSDNFGTCVLFSLILTGVNVGTYVVRVPFQLGMEFFQEDLAAIFFVGIAQVICELLIQAAITCLFALFGLHLVQNKPAPLSSMWAVHRHIVPMFLLQLVFILIGIVAVGLCVAPLSLIFALQDGNLSVIAIVVSIALFIPVFLGMSVLYLAFFLSSYLVIDQRLGVFESLRTSAIYMKGNKTTAGLLLFVTVLLSFVFSLVTCFIGLLFVYGYFAVLTALIYLTATGQRQSLTI